jgi:hypothetical protein
MTILIIPMAGRGQRFSEYKIPKPFLKLSNGNYMFVEAVNTFVRHENFDAVILVILGSNKQYIKNLGSLFDSKIPLHIAPVYINKVTEGQAQTCYLATKNLRGSSILISACDNSAEYDHKKFYDSITNREQNLIVIWTFDDPKEDLKEDPSSPSTYSWALIDQDDNIVEVHTKQKNNNNNENYRYRPIVGTFYFSDSEYFNEGYRYIYDNNIRYNNELYIENMFNYLIGPKGPKGPKGLIIKNFSISKYIGWGIPKDYETNKFIYEINK